MNYKNKKHFLLLLFIMVLSINAFSIFNSMNYIKKSESITVDDSRLMASSNPVSLIWNRTWFESPYIARGNAIALDSSNNSYITGYGDFSEASVVKYSSSGQLQWARTWGLTSRVDGSMDEGQAILVSSTNDIYVAGDTHNIIFLLKYNSTGDLQWSSFWGGSGVDYCYGMAIDNNDNIFLAGVTNSWIASGSAMCLIKFNTAGVLQWNRTWGGGSNDGAMGIVVDSSDNIYLGGTTGYDMCLVKFDNSGVWQWNQSWSAGWGISWGTAIAIDSADNIYLVGEGYVTDNVTYDWQIYLLKYNKFGVLQWSNMGDHDKTGLTFKFLINGISLDSSNNIYVAKTTIDDDMEIVKFDSSGNQKWNYVFGGTGTDSCNGIVIDTRNDIYIVGTLDNEAYIAKFSENPPGSSELGIPGYNQWMLFGVLSIVTSVIAFSISLKIKRFKKIN